jgi:hypothetical protein
VLFLQIFMALNEGNTGYEATELYYLVGIHVCVFGVFVCVLMLLNGSNASLSAAEAVVNVDDVTVTNEADEKDEAGFELTSVFDFELTPSGSGV